MKGIPIILISLILTGGCIQSPAKVASGMPGVWKNVSNDVGNVTGPIGQNLSIFVMGTPTATIGQTSESTRIVRV
jgi:hypothetical protein